LAEGLAAPFLATLAFGEASFTGAAFGAVAFAFALAAFGAAAFAAVDFGGAASFFAGPFAELLAAPFDAGGRGPVAPLARPATAPLGFAFAICQISSYDDRRRPRMRGGMLGGAPGQSSGKPPPAR
jgi:hypothetical protein